jgi:alpha-1,2-mannosyltransferase
MPLRSKIRGVGNYGAAVVAATSLCIYMAIWARKYGLDLRVYRDSANAFVSGHNPYSSTFTQSHLALTYPPFALAVLSSTTWASFAVTEWLLWAVSVAATTAAVMIVLVDRGFELTASTWCASFAWACCSILVLEPARSGVNYGQIEFVLMFLVVADVLLIPSPFRGVAIGVAAAIKLTPLIFILIFVVRRDRASVIRTALSFLACTVLAWLLWPNLSRSFWLHDVTQPGRVGGVTYAGNQSVFAVLHRSPFPATGSVVGWVVLSVTTVLVGSFVAWRCVRTDRQSFALMAIALVGLMISPISWTHHWVWVLLLPPMLVGTRRHQTERFVRIMLWGIVALTTVAPYWWFSAGWAGDALQAVLPVWTFVTLAMWCAAEYSSWKRATDTPRRTEVDKVTVI